MTTLYRSVLIESAEQAEALPAGTVALHGSPGGRTVASRLPDPHGLLLGWITSDGRESFAGMVGWSALVPIEAVTITRQTELCKPGRTIRYIADIEEDQ